jgi:hypothetical protein
MNPEPSATAPVERMKDEGGRMSKTFAAVISFTYDYASRSDLAARCKGASPSIAEPDSRCSTTERGESKNVYATALRFSLIV